MIADTCRKQVVSNLLQRDQEELRELLKENDLAMTEFQDRPLVEEDSRNHQESVQEGQAFRQTCTKAYTRAKVRTFFLIQNLLLMVFLRILDSIEIVQENPMILIELLVAHLWEAFSCNQETCFKDNRTTWVKKQQRMIFQQLIQISDLK